VSDQAAPPLGPPSDLRWPPEHPGDGAAGGRKMAPWAKWFTGLGVLVIVVIFAGSVIRLPYDTLAPGGTLNLETRVSAKGVKTYSTRGNVMLLFVRERAHVNLWAWLQAKLDPDIDLVKQVQITGGNSQQESDEQDVCDMSQSQESAKVAALLTLGYHVPELPGLAIVDLPPAFDTAGKADAIIAHPLFAVKVLQPCDEVVSADGHVLRQSDDLSKYVKAHKPGTSVTLGIVRAGKPLTVHVPVVSDAGTSIIGVALAPRFRVPLDINLNTSDVSGPSAGLAMALAIIDNLTPGDLTGGKRVAVTGTIDPDGNVGEIGGLPQKAVVARTAHAQIFIVPVCTDDGCKKDLATAKKRVGKNVELRPVATLAQALKVLRAAGGAPLPAPSKG
jgi:PDZ domain-containing protein